jgi:hypothetical protein
MWLPLVGATVAVTGCAVGSAPLDMPSGVSPPSVSVPTARSSRPVPTASTATVATVTGTPRASDVLGALAVRGRAPATGYRRALYGDGWADEDGDGCSTREEILERDLVNTTVRRSGSCQVIATGVLADPYSGRSITFRRGTDTSSLVQIDHVVALMDSWQTGAQQLTPARREQLANDPLNLLAVDGAANEGKGASDAASWLPPNRAYRCAYVARQVAVKSKYGLWVTPAEKVAITRVLTTCPAQPIPTS